MQRYDGTTSDGERISCVIAPEKQVAIVDYCGEEFIRFLLHPDFPQDAKALFDALERVRGIVVTSAPVAVEGQRADRLLREGTLFECLFEADYLLRSFWACDGVGLSEVRTGTELVDRAARLALRSMEEKRREK